MAECESLCTSDVTSLQEGKSSGEGGAGEDRERRVIVEGFEERGGILKLKEQRQQEEKIGYAPWDQKPAWFDAPGNSEQPPLPSYTAVQEMLNAKPTAVLKSTHDKDSDYERLKARAELSYLNGDYLGSVKAWLAILGQYKIGNKGRPGGLRLEALDSIGRSLEHIDVELVSVHEAELVVMDLKESIAPQHRPVFHSVYARLLQRAGRHGEALAPLQALAACHPADPGLWLDLADGYLMVYRCGSGCGDGEAEGKGARRRILPILARRCLRLAAKMVRVCSNAVQCQITLARHAKIFLCLQDRLSTSPFSHLDETPVRPAGTGGHSRLAGEGCAAGEAADLDHDVICQSKETYRVTKRDLSGAGGEAAELESLELVGRLEELELGDEELEACQAWCNEMERTWLLSDASQVKAAKDAQVVLRPKPGKGEEEEEDQFITA